MKNRIKLTAYLTRKEVVEIDEHQVEELVETHVRKVFDLNYEDIRVDAYGDLVESWENSAGAHSWTETKTIRKANPRDLLGLEVLNILKNHKRQREKQ